MTLSIAAVQSTMIKMPVHLCQCITVTRYTFLNNHNMLSRHPTHNPNLNKTMFMSNRITVRITITAIV